MKIPKLPLNVDLPDIGKIADIINNDDEIIAEFVSKDDAEYIVHACNLYPKLVEALEMCVDEFDNFPRSLGYKITHIPRIKEILTKAKNV